MALGVAVDAPGFTWNDETLTIEPVRPAQDG